ncbi:hypothetical protein ABB37_02888 [Leptomonas pyrrhocoris]|uniref:Uncharacterized protein n=1 Tax=Leptomonas pyrrhocoris TaxID=157538 RepID=A0A0N0VGB4_LEPPY|nr:hypothetical protein ABB37_02888 [Leptomonas pyrrhocoris]KPA83204.1 hypothetical protein ABB37_02888 [Leptomonas pyrrhocoris]|eukprot:XP_015661643.1 hypothetical protein ABB37_02888 [Leptomonas pyrrhocoris]
MSSAKAAASKKKKSPIDNQGKPAAATPAASKDAKAEASTKTEDKREAEQPQNAKHVVFNDSNLRKVIHIPRDQIDPVAIWNVYSHVAYSTKREQRYLQRCLSTRIHESLERCPTLFPDPPSKGDPDQQSKLGRLNRNLDGKFAEFLKEQGYGKNVVACAIYVMSVWPSFPLLQRPPISPRVQRAMEALQNGTRLYVFNEKPNSPLKCGAALRMLHGIDADEASIAIFNPDEPSVIDGYIPMSFIVSLTFGLESVEKDHHLRKDGKVLCADGERRFLESPKRAFTIHCAAPDKFYVTFIAPNQMEFDNWTRVVDYFVLLNACCRTYIQSR